LGVIKVRKKKMSYCVRTNDFYFYYVCWTEWKEIGYDYFTDEPNEDYVKKKYPNVSSSKDSRKYSLQYQFTNNDKTNNSLPRNIDTFITQIQLYKGCIELCREKIFEYQNQIQQINYTKKREKTKENLIEP
jgi:hypothetical protein